MKLVLNNKKDNILKVQKKANKQSKKRGIYEQFKYYR